MKLAIAAIAAALAVTPLASAGAADVLAANAAESRVIAAEVQPQPAPPASDPLPWEVILSVIGLGVVGVITTGRRETRIRFTFK